MKVFVSWSGQTSKRVASALRNWLSDMFHDVEPWMSEQDIAPGSRWHASLNTELEASKFGVLCLTDDNLTSPWLLFEAGCLSRDLSTARVIPYLFGLTLANVGPPLSQFQGVLADEEGTYRLAASINSALSRPLLEDKLRRTFTRWWPDLCNSLESINDERGSILAALRTERAMLEELIDIAREIRGATTKSYSVQYEEAVRRIFGVIESVRRMDRPAFDKAVKEAEVAASRDDPGAAGAQLFLEVATRWLSLGVATLPVPLSLTNASPNEKSRRQAKMKKREPR